MSVTTVSPLDAGTVGAPYAESLFPSVVSPTPPAKLMLER